YAAGPLGEFYQADAGLRDQGSRTAAEAGLYHHTTQVNQAVEGDSTVDVGFHYIAVDITSGAPLDSDGDQLPDYVEDLNGNGTLDPRETDPLQEDTDHDHLCDFDEWYWYLLHPYGGPYDPRHPDTDRDGWPDGAEAALEDPQWCVLYPHDYTLWAWRDFDTLGRSPALPDAEVTMTWEHDQPGSLDREGDYAECHEDPPPETILGEGDLLEWPADGDGTEKHWHTTYGDPNTRVWGEPSGIPRPPSSTVAVPWEYRGMFSMTMDPPSSGTYIRDAYTTVYLKTHVPQWPKDKISLILGCWAWDLTSGSSLDPTATGYGLGEPVTGDRTTPVDAVATPISVAGQVGHVPSAGNYVNVMVQWGKEDDAEVTPEIALQWYDYEMQVSLPHPITLTWSHHPGVTSLPDLQAAFDEGARLLARDDDGPGEGGDQDDWACYLEFFILTPKASEFPEDFSGDEFIRVTDFDELLMLQQAPFANIKLVESISIDRGENDLWKPLGFAVPPNGMVLTVAGVDAVTVVHELGHLCGLEHRTNNADAIMYPVHGARDEVSRPEASKYLQCHLAIWGW
ncbi:MAG: hypothetical protein D6766_09205, partial [Verrucomicrobia bacterium]